MIFSPMRYVEHLQIFKVKCDLMGWNKLGKSR